MNNGLERVFYRETVQDSGVADGKVIRQRGGVGVYAHVRVEVRALRRGEGNAIEWSAGLNVPTRFVSAVLNGVQDALDAGVLGGFEMTDVCVSVMDGSYHDVDSTPDAFREAARTATTEAIQQARPVVLEALSLVTIAAPQHLVDTVKAALGSRGAVAAATILAADSQTLTANVPTFHESSLIVELLRVSDGAVRISTRNNGFRQRPEPPESFGPWAAMT